MKNNIVTFFALFSLIHQVALGQVFSYQTFENGQSINHRILMDEVYYVETQFTTNSNQFIKTVGGFYQKKGDQLVVDLEFNSNFPKDSLKNIVIEKTDHWKRVSEKALPLNGKWLMAGRVMGDQERRRDTERSRKTMKILLAGYFQWIAYDTATFSFYGTGGGRYTASDGTYTENIDYFSRDNSKVGIALDFEYQRKGADWYHKGFSSKGDPFHEIWTSRTQ